MSEENTTTTVDFINNLRSILNPKTFIKHRFVVCGVQPAALAERGIGIMKQAALTACILFKDLHET